MAAADRARQAGARSPARATIAAWHSAHGSRSISPSRRGSRGDAGCRRSRRGCRSASTSRSLVRRLAFLSAVLLAAIWALAGRGYFWPAWAWLGLGDSCCSTSRQLGLAAPAGAVRRVACVWALVGVGRRDPVSTWLLTWLLAGVADLLARLGAVRPRDRRERLLADRPARPRPGGPRAACAARPDRHAHAHPPAGRRRAGRRAAADRARPARRRAGAAGGADAPARPRGDARADQPECAA